MSDLEPEHEYMKVIPNISKMLEDDDPENDFPISREMKRDERYQEGSKLGQGAMKQVTLAQDAVTDRKVALAKLIEANNLDQTEQFFLEARLTARLQHPNIIPVYDAGYNEQGEAFFTMKPVGQDTLKTFLDSQSNENHDYQQRLEIFSKICDAMAFAHSNGIIHRDLKPENIYLGEFGEVLVGDWGLAKVTGEEDAELDSLYKDKASALQTLDGYIKGTPGYMAPEQIDKTIGLTDEQSDIYALGALLYKMLYLEKLHPGSKLEGVLKSTLEEVTLSPNKQGHTPSSLESIIYKALAVDKAERYLCVADLKNDLKKFQGGFMTSAEKNSFLKSFLYLLKRHKQVSALLALILCGSLIFTLKIYQEKERAETQRNNAIHQRQIAEEQKSEAISQKKLADEARQKREEISKSASPRFLKVAIDDFLNFKFASAFNNIEMAVSLDPENHEAFRYKAHFLFMTQKFNEANKLFKSLPGNHSFPRKHRLVLDKYLNIKKDDELRLPVAQLLNFLKDSQNLYTPDKPPRPYVKYLANAAYLQQYYSLQQKMEIANFTLKQMNPRLNGSFQLKYEKTADGKLSIDLSGYSQLVSIEALRLLAINKLDISATHVKDVGVLSAAPIGILIAKDMRIPPQEIRKLKSLKEIHTNSSHFDGKLNSKIKIIKVN